MDNVMPLSPRRGRIRSLRVGIKSNIDRCILLAVTISLLQVSVPAKDIYHDTVRRALQNDGWTITHDPFPLQIGKKRLSADLGAERLISAERGLQRIVVEVKSFVGPSDVKDLEQALGQYVLYRQILDEMGIEQSLYLAVSQPTFNSVFTIELGQVLLKNQVIKLIVFDDESEAIVQWIPD